MLKGMITALVTPFKDGVLDVDAFTKIVNWQVEQGIHGLLVCGTTGESPTLSTQERDTIVKSCVDVVAGRVPVVVGTGTNSTAKTIEMTQHAKASGADATLLVTPYYNKPSQEGLYAHFKAVNDAVDIPQYIYNTPRSAVDINDKTIARLAPLKNVAGVKDSSNDIARPLLLSEELKAENDNFVQLTAIDDLALAFNANGGRGIFSVAGNIAPALCSQLQELSLAGDFVGARAIHKKLMPLYLAMSCDTNPVPVNYAMSLLGMMSDEVRLPLVGLSDEHKKQVKKAMQELELI